MATVSRLSKDGACTPGCMGAYGPCASVPAKKRRGKRRSRKLDEPLCRCACKGEYHGALADVHVPGSEKYRSPAPKTTAEEPTFYDAALLTHRYKADPYAKALPDDQGQPCMPPCCLPRGHAVHELPRPAAGRGKRRKREEVVPASA